MWAKIKAILIRSIPYLFCCVCGICLFFIGINFIDNSAWRSLTTSLAGTLLGIPVVFLVFHSTDYYTKKELNKKLVQNLIDKANKTIDQVLKVMWNAISVTDKINRRSIRKTASIDVKNIQAKLKITGRELQKMKQIKKDMDELEYSATRLAILSDNQTSTIVSMAQELTHLINDREFHGNKKSQAISVQKILVLGSDWYDSNRRNRSNYEQSLAIAMDNNDKRPD